MTKTEIMASLAEDTGLTKKQVASVFEELAKLMGGEKISEVTMQHAREMLSQN